MFKDSKVKEPDCDGTLVSCEECVSSAFEIYRFKDGNEHILIPNWRRTNPACPIVTLHVEQSVPIGKLVFPDQTPGSEFKRLRQRAENLVEDERKERIAASQLLKDDMDCLFGLLPMAYFSKLDEEMIARVTAQIEKCKGPEKALERFEEALKQTYPGAYRMRTDIYSERSLESMGEGIGLLEYLQTPMICMYYPERKH